MTTMNGLSSSPVRSFVLSFGIPKGKNNDNDLTATRDRRFNSNKRNRRRVTVLKKKKSEAENCSYSSWTTTTNGSNNNGNGNVSGGIYKYKYKHPIYYWYQPVIFSFHRYAINDTLHIIHYPIGSPFVNTRIPDIRIESSRGSRFGSWLSRKMNKFHVTHRQY